MNLFDDAGSKPSGGSAAGGGAQGLVACLLEIISHQQGGIVGLAEAFQRKDLGHIVSSWVGTGENLPVSTEQIQQVLGNEQIRALAQKTGLSFETAAWRLTQVLPSIVDMLTPGGQMPEW